MTQKIAARGTYNKRSAPQAYDAGFFNIELGNIQRAIPVGKTRTVRADYTLDVTDGLVLADATDGNIVILLPDPARAQGLVFTVKKKDPSINIVEFLVEIDGVPGRFIGGQYEGFTVQSDGTAYWLLASV